MQIGDRVTIRALVQEISPDGRAVRVRLGHGNDVWVDPWDIERDPPVPPMGHIEVPNEVLRRIGLASTMDEMVAWQTIKRLVDGAIATKAEVSKEEHPERVFRGSMALATDKSNSLIFVSGDSGRPGCLISMVVPGAMISDSARNLFREGPRSFRLPVTITIREYEPEKPKLPTAEDVVQALHGWRGTFDEMKTLVHGLVEPLERRIKELEGKDANT